MMDNRRDVLTLIESNYYEEQRRLKMLDREHDFQLETRRMVFDTFVAVISGA